MNDQAPATATAADAQTAWEALAPSAEIADFSATARAHFRSLFPTDVLRELLDGSPAPVDRWSALVEQGYALVGVPEELGGLGSLADLTAILEEAGRALVPLPLLTTVAATQTLLAADIATEQLGDAPASLAIAADAGAQTRLPVFDGVLAEHLVVVSGTEQAANVALVKASGGEPETEPVDASRPVCFVSYDDAAVLERVQLPGTALDDVLAAARVCAASDLIGVAALALDGAIEHALVREQFDRPIGSFQAVKHLLADTYVALERARSLTLGAAAELAQRPVTPSARRLSLLAKAAASDVALHATAVHTQLLGAMGLTWESDNHLAVRRAHHSARYLGSASDLYVAAARIRDGVQK